MAEQTNKKREREKIREIASSSSTKKKKRYIDEREDKFTELDRKMLHFSQKKVISLLFFSSVEMRLFEKKKKDIFFSLSFPILSKKPRSQETRATLSGRGFVIPSTFLGSPKKKNLSFFSFWFGLFLHQLMRDLLLHSVKIVTRKRKEKKKVGFFFSKQKIALFFRRNNNNKKKLEFLLAPSRANDNFR